MTTTANASASHATNRRLGKRILQHVANMCDEVYRGQTQYPFPSPFYQETYHTITLHKNLLGDQGHVNAIIGEDADNIYVCFSGTDDFEFWLYNTDTEVVPMKPNGVIYYVHQGFMELMIEVLRS